MEPYVLRTSAKRLWWVYLILGLTTVTGLWLASRGIGSGWLVAGVTGGIGIALFLLLHGRVMLTADVEGVRPGKHGVIPWRDIESIGAFVKWTGTTRQNWVGIRLTSYDALLASLPDNVLRNVQRFGPTLRYVGFGAITLDIATSGSGIEAAAGALANAPEFAALSENELDGYAKWLVLNRRMTGGWDLAYSSSMVGSAKHVAAHLEEMRVTMQSRAPGS